MCVAESWKSILYPNEQAGDLKSALKDLTRASHMKPDVQQLYILR